MKGIVVLLVLALAALACSSAPAVTATPYPTYTPYPTLVPPRPTVRPTPTQEPAAIRSWSTGGLLALGLEEIPGAAEAAGCVTPCNFYLNADGSLLIGVFSDDVGRVSGVAVTVWVNLGDAAANGETTAYALAALGVPAEVTIALSEAGTPPQSGISNGWRYETSIDYQEETLNIMLWAPGYWDTSYGL